jgi:dephospho-CoA kinase
VSRAAPLRLGLTGGIGSGKSTVAAALAALGARVVDTDAISRQLTAVGGSALPAIALAFGADMMGVDGTLDRAKLRNAAFGHPTERARLEAILHPLIGQEAQRQAGSALPGQVVVFDVPLLTESPHWRSRVDRILVVDCDVSLQVERVVQRSGWGPGEVRRVIGQQAPRAARRAIADAVIVNQGLDLAGLQAQVARLWRHWVLAEHGPQAL